VGLLFLCILRFYVGGLYAFFYKIYYLKKKKEKKIVRLLKC